MENAKTNIFCPNCGANNKIEQSFCRFCGLKLADSIKVLRAQFKNEEKTRQFVKLEWIKRASDTVVVVLSVSVVVVVLSFAYGFYTNTDFATRRLWMSLIISLLFAQSGLSYLRRKNTVGYHEESMQKRAATNEELQTPETKKLIADPSFEPVSSGAENSTELLFTKNDARKFE